MVDETFCSGCEFCPDICPFDCLEIIRDATAPLSKSIVTLVKPKDCVACRLCEDVCQKEAITVRFPDGTRFVGAGRGDGDDTAAA